MNYILAITIGHERYVFVYDRVSLGELLRTFGKYAADPDLSFGWQDAALLSARALTLIRETK